METVAFTAEGKSLSTTELSSGDLAVTGYAVVWEGLDQQGENLMRGSVRDAIPAFLSGSAPFVHHHSGHEVLGRVLNMHEDNVGVRFSARVDKQLPGSPLFHIYEGIRRGSIRGLSIAGYFLRHGAKMINRVLRITEVSATSMPSHPGPRFDVVEVKSLDALDGISARLDQLRLRELDRRADLVAVKFDVAAISRSAAGL